MARVYFKLDLSCSGVRYRNPLYEVKAYATLRKLSYCSAVSPNSQEHLSHQGSLQARVGKLCDFS